MASQLLMRVIATRGGKEREYSFSKHELNGELLLGTQKSSYYIPYVRVKRGSSSGDGEGSSGGAKLVSTRGDGCKMSLLLGGSEEYMEGFLARTYFGLKEPEASDAAAAKPAVSGDMVTASEGEGDDSEGACDCYVCFNQPTHLEGLEVVDINLKPEGMLLEKVYEHYIMPSFVGDPTVKEVAETIFTAWDAGKEYRQKSITATASKKRKQPESDEQELQLMIKPYDGSLTDKAKMEKWLTEATDYGYKLKDMVEKVKEMALPIMARVNMLDDNTMCCMECTGKATYMCPYTSCLCVFCDDHSSMGEECPVCKKPVADEEWNRIKV